MQSRVRPLSQEPSKILVTGGAGFIGSAVCRRLVASGASVVNFDKLTYAACLASLAEIEHSNRYAFVRGDVADRQAVRAALQTHQPDAIMHLAAETHVDRSIDSAEPFIQTNIVGTFVLLEEVLVYWRGLPAERAHAFRFLHISTDEVYGSLGETGRFSETTPYVPARPIPPPRRPPTTWSRPGATPTAFRSWSPTARTTMGPINFQKS